MVKSFLERNPKKQNPKKPVGDATDCEGFAVKNFHRAEAGDKNIKNHGLSFILVWCEQRGSRWFTTSAWQGRRTLKVFKYINMVLDGFLQHKDRYSKRGNKMYPKSGSFTTIPTDANLGNLNIFPFKVSSLFHAEPSFACFSFWILDYTLDVGWGF